MSDQRLRTGELAEQAGVNVQTLRYYERRGLLAAPARRPSGQREYGEDAVRLLHTIKAVQRLGFTLAEIEELLDLSEHRRGTGELHRRPRPRWPRSTPRSTSSPGCAKPLWRYWMPSATRSPTVPADWAAPSPSWSSPALEALVADTVDPPLTHRRTRRRLPPVGSGSG
jgi:DNA-binding transcriptional MerR regulator